MPLAVLSAGSLSWASHTLCHTWLWLRAQAPMETLVSGILQHSGSRLRNSEFCRLISQKVRESKLTVMMLRFQTAPPGKSHSHPKELGHSYWFTLSCLLSGKRHSLHLLWSVHKINCTQQIVYQLLTGHGRRLMLFIAKTGYKYNQCVQQVTF